MILKLLGTPVQIAGSLENIKSMLGYVFKMIYSAISQESFKTEHNCSFHHRRCVCSLLWTPYSDCLVKQFVIGLHIVDCI